MLQRESAAHPEDRGTAGAADGHALCDTQQARDSDVQQTMELPQVQHTESRRHSCDATPGANHPDSSDATTGASETESPAEAPQVQYGARDLGHPCPTNHVGAGC